MRDLRRRPAARLLVIDRRGCVLLFRFAFSDGALAGHDYWATPGGGVEPGESVPHAARRELLEETGLRVDDVGRVVARRDFIMRLTSGEDVVADESFFRISTDRFTPARHGWSPDEEQAIVDHHWWSLDELARRTVQVWPDDIADMVRSADRPAT